MTDLHQKLTRASRVSTLPSHQRGENVPGHALHEKGLQRQVAVGTLVSSQQRRALAVPLTNRWSTGCFVPPPVYIGFPLFVLAKNRLEKLLMVPWGARGTVAFRADRNVGSLFCPAWPRTAVRHAPRRPDPPVVCPGFGLDRSSASCLVHSKEGLGHFCALKFRDERLWVLILALPKRMQEAVNSINSRTCLA